MAKKNKYTVVDLFCGAGGLSKGFMDAGFDILLGVDFDDAALKTFESNHGNAKAMKLNLFDHNNILEIKKYLDDNCKSLDVLIGGPPCQGFSLAGTRKEDDERNALYIAMVKTAELLKPKVVLLENVPGMLTLYDGKVKKRILNDFSKLGYNMDVKVLYAPEFGVPQIRKRAFYVGLLNSETKFSYPVSKFSPSEFITCKQALCDLPSLVNDTDYSLTKTRNYVTEPLNNYQKMMRKKSSIVFNHYPTRHEKKTVDTIALVPDGGDYRDLPPEIAKRFKYHESMTRYNSNKPSLTIDTGHRTHFHYEYNRIPSVRESARLQSFPDDFVFYGSKQQQYKQVGNAVPPLLGKSIAFEIKKFLDKNKCKYNVIDLFAGCGGLLDGFMQSGKINPVASVEWEKAPVNTLIHRLKNKWKILDCEKSVLRFDMQRIDELFDGYSDEIYGESEGIKKIIGNKKIDFIIGGPPCQAYSVAGRRQQNNFMKDDYRNYLFEYYLQFVERVNPKLFVFENVPGMLSAMPDGTPIIDLIRRDIENKGFIVIDNISKYAIINAVDFCVPQNRKRVILLGLNKKYFNKLEAEKILEDFYCNMLPKQKSDKVISVGDAIGDLPPCYPLMSEKRPSHTIPECVCSWHFSRFHCVRDVQIFKMLAKDIEDKKFEYIDSNKLIKVYNEATGANTKVHKYHVLRKDQPSTTLLAHLYKDGLRFIHYDSQQARSITVREAARLQSFDDDFEFIGTQGDAYKMIGNAVPPKLALSICKAIIELIDKYL